MKTQFFWFICICIAPVFLISITGCGEEIVEDEEITAEATVEIAPPPEGMVLIPAGEFEMGKSVQPPALKGYYGHVEPVHTVYVDAFYMDKYEVTNEQYVAFLNAMRIDGGVPAVVSEELEKFKHFLVDGVYRVDEEYKNFPVRGATWYGAMAYAIWAGKRLPTEAEWEKAARGGLEGKDYPWGNENDWPPDYNGDYRSVGENPPNGYGLYDMAGNLREWCLDEYDPNFYENSPILNPIAGAISVEWIVNNYTEIKTERVLRGGTWWGTRSFSHLVFVRIPSRKPGRPDPGTSGFRCVKDISP